MPVGKEARLEVIPPQPVAAPALEVTPLAEPGALKPDAKSPF
jgi:hypothetical protein